MDRSLGGCPSAASARPLALPECQHVTAVSVFPARGFSRFRHPRLIQKTNQPKLPATHSQKTSFPAAVMDPFPPRC